MRRLLALQRNRQSLDDLESATSALTRSVDDALKTARSALPSTVARLRELTRDPDDPAPAGIEVQKFDGRDWEANGPALAGLSSEPYTATEER